MLPGAQQPVIRRLLCRTTNGAIQALGWVVDLKGDAPFSGTEVDLATRHGELQSICLDEE